MQIAFQILILHFPLSFENIYSYLIDVLFSLLFVHKIQFMLVFYYTLLLFLHIFFLKSVLIFCQIPKNVPIFHKFQSPIVVWRMKAPEKKPLIRPEKPEEVRAKVRRGSQKKQPSPIHALAEFQSPAESV